MLYITTATGDQQFEQFADAREVADGHTAEHGVEVKVFGLLESDEGSTEILAYHTSPNVVNGVVQGHFAPWHRIEPVPSTFVPRYFPGYTLAYKRTRIATAVYRKDDRTGWMVWESETDTQHHVPNTKAACNLTSDLAAQRRAARAAAPAAV